MVLVNALVHAGTAIPSLSGKSVNLDKSLYLGVFGWESLAVCDKYSLTFNTANIFRNMIRHIRKLMWRVQRKSLKLSEASARLWQVLPRAEYRFHHSRNMYCSNKEISTNRKMAQSPLSGYVVLGRLVIN